MPRQLMAVAVRTPALCEYDEEPLRAGEIRVRAEYGSVKHGTELHMYRADNPFADAQWDRQRRIFLPGAGAGARAGAAGSFPMPLGNMTVGIVTEVGTGVAGVAIGDRVAGYGPLRK